MKTLSINITYNKLFHAISIFFDIFSISYFLYSSFFLDVPIIPLEIFLGIYFTIEYIILFIASEDRLKYIRHPLAISNILIIIGYLSAPFWNLGFLRILRVLRVVHLYQIIPDIRSVTKKIIIWEKLLATIMHALVLIFILTEVVFILQSDINEDINTRFDAFYFTTNAITKVGNGEGIKLVETEGRILTLIIAIISLSIFVQLLDTARETQRRRKEKMESDNKKLTKKEMEEIYSEQLCTYCDIKERERINEDIKK